MREGGANGHEAAAALGVYPSVHALLRVRRSWRDAEYVQQRGLLQLSHELECHRGQDYGGAPRPIAACIAACPAIDDALNPREAIIAAALRIAPAAQAGGDLPSKSAINPVS